MSLAQILKSADSSQSFQKIKDSINSDKRKVLVSGLVGSGKSLLLACLKKELASPLVVITSSPEESWKIYEDLISFLGAEKVRLFPSWEILPYELKIPHSEVIGRRLESLYDLVGGKSPAVVTTIRACLEKTIRPEELKKSSIVLSVGESADPDDLSRQMLHLGFKRLPQVEEIGTFSIKGGILDIFPYSSSDPVRIEFFGDEIESIRTFAVLDQRSIRKINSTLILPKREVLISDNRLEECLSKLKSHQADSLREKIRFHEDVPALEWLASLFDLSQAQISDYLSPDSLIFLDEPSMIEGELDKIYEETQKLFAEAQDKGEAVPEPRTLWGQPESLLGKISQFRTVHHLSLGEKKDAIDLAMQEPEVFAGDVSLLKRSIQKYQIQKQKVFVFCDNLGQKERLVELLDTLADGIAWQVKNLSGGFSLPEIGLVVLTDHQIFSRYFWRRRKRRFNEGIALSSYSALSFGDFVVHIDHGIGRYSGLEALEVDKRKRECLKLVYQGDDKLYVPIEEFNRVHKFVGKEGAPTLSKLGGTAWENLKKRTKKTIQDMAQELIQLYAERKAKPGLVFSADTVWQKELEASFIYEETPDQLAAIDSVKTDMEQKTPADRLICGDVGYGKTEVAVRAAFKGVMDGKQVAVLVPTTILAQQHFVTFSERLKSFPVNVAVLSRFKSRKEQKEILQNLKEGKVDVVIGTHRLIQRDVQFKDLALLIIDEEQRFGVAHKEKIKKLRRLVDVVTLTATPIPRTLQLSLLGARDMSIINTPPKDRLPIHTEIVEFDKKLIADAILREVDRGGQVYFVHNRVQTIEAMYRFLQDLVPQIRIAIAHGQMEESLLERVMLDFLNHRYDLLLVTSIIESGIDIPSVNTVIIDRADRFGLAQLYQLRGRVGRSNVRAYAYLLIPKIKILTHTARKRLKALEQFTQLGSGFHLALRDLEIRGAGNLLGPQQHGFIEEVGFDLYCRLLDEAVRELKGEPIERLLEVKMEFDIDIYIPESYVADSQQRVEIYRKLSDAKSVEEVKEVEAEMIDRFGTPQKEVQDLLNFTSAKIIASRLGISRVSLRKDILTLQFSEDKKMTKKEIEKLRTNIDLPLEFAVEKTLKLFISLKNLDERKSLFVKNLLQRL
jgi:transcription-repair coupling factor (superfamily II helicase)